MKFVFALLAIAFFSCGVEMKPLEEAEMKYLVRADGEEKKDIAMESLSDEEKRDILFHVAKALVHGAIHAVHHVGHFLHHLFFGDDRQNDLSLEETLQKLFEDVKKNHAVEKLDVPKLIKDIKMKPLAEADDKELEDFLRSSSEQINYILDSVRTLKADTALESLSDEEKRDILFHLAKAVVHGAIHAVHHVAHFLHGLFFGDERQNDLSLEETLQKLFEDVKKNHVVEKLDVPKLNKADNAYEFDWPAFSDLLDEAKYADSNSNVAVDGEW